MFHQNTTLRANPKIFSKKQINYFPITTRERSKLLNSTHGKLENNRENKIIKNEKFFRIVAHPRSS
jgi:hypothetical protein